LLDLRRKEVDCQEKEEGESQGRNNNNIKHLVTRGGLKTLAHQQAMKVQAYLVGGAPFIGDLEDILLAHLKHNFPDTHWNMFSSWQPHQPMEYIKGILYKEGKITNFTSQSIPEITKGMSGLRARAFLVGQVPFIGKLEDILQVYVHHNCPRKLWKSFSSSQKERFKDHIYEVLIKHGQIELLPPSKAARKDLSNKMIKVMTSCSESNQKHKTSKKAFGPIKDLCPINDKGQCPINKTNGALDTMLVHEVLKLPKEHWKSLHITDRIKLCENLRKKVHKWVDQEYKKERTSPAGNDVETTSPKEKQGLVAEKAPTVGELPHQEDQDKRELYTIRRVNTLTSQLTVKGELGSQSRGDSNKETNEQPMGEKVINSTHSETSLRGDSDCMLKSLKNTPNVNRGEDI